MDSLKFLHFSDIHLDAPFGSLGSKHAAEQRRRDLIDIFDRIIYLAKKEAVDIILISGDLYEHEYVRKSTIHYINKKFGEIPEIKVFIVPGNHDPYIPNSYYRNFEWSKNVYILSEDRQKVFLKEHNACVYGVGFANFHEEKSLINTIEPADPKHINILLVHGTVDLNFKKSRYNPMASSELALLGMDYIALGHFHNSLRGIGKGGNIYNPGSPEPLGFDEEGEHGVFIGKIDFVSERERKLDVRFEKTYKRQYKSLEIKSDCFESDNQIIDMIFREAREDQNRENLMHIILRGYTVPGYRINAADIADAIGNSFFYVVISDETVNQYNYDELVNEPGIKGLFVRKMFSLINKAESEKERHLLMKSMQYGIEALEQGKVEVL
ncbi:metallophosphoesterase family protein [Acetivibrio straminisolvens]|jgi:DNA repair exonuclease SbcCD nuclease subunit|uniref:DNA double-strand break repair protein Mre11 n=1 Tax=Acetivibrio straminisolvens JCM 21531 TaxID=1294263 RepID=W4V5U2_9FIRM|nr:DNA repair exonuclease [Acetivibrio straminisolvens]GAE88551.1 DNA double-strand break repair protein Mre11 [Acetivibrio straminisolvens JCM 21531]